MRQYGDAQRFYHEVVLRYEGGKCLFWPFAKQRGYGTMRIKDRLVRVHRRLCEEMNGPPPTPEHDAAHSCGCGDYGCVTKGHLEWKTRKENLADEIAHGTRLLGERNHSAKLTAENVREIRLLFGVRGHVEIGQMFGVQEECIRRIATGQTWGHVPTGGH